MKFWVPPPKNGIRSIIECPLGILQQSLNASLEFVGHSRLDVAPLQQRFSFAAVDFREEEGTDAPRERCCRAITVGYAPADVVSWNTGTREFSTWRMVECLEEECAMSSCSGQAVPEIIEVGLDFGRSVEDNRAALRPGPSPRG